MDQNGTATARSSTPGWGAKLHFALLALVPGVLLAPPSSGAMLLVPVVPASADQVAVWSSRAGARLVGPGPTPGSLVVEGSSSPMWRAALAHGAVITKADAAGCGEGGESK